MSEESRVPTLVLALTLLAAACAALLVPSPAAARATSGPSAAKSDLGTTRLTIVYRAHNGKRRAATVLVPAWYGPASNPPIPLIISPHGRGLTGRQNAALWGNLPAKGGFAVISPDGHGRTLPLHSWGYTGQIRDLARMPQLLQWALPWLRIDPKQIYAFGGSMGGQETLLLAARYPRLLAGAAAFSSVTDFAYQYGTFAELTCHAGCVRTLGGPIGPYLQRLARTEVGGTPRTALGAYRARSPLAQARRLAFSCVPLQLWWSMADRIVRDQDRHSRRLAEAIRTLNPYAQLHTFSGLWIHTAEMNARTHLPRALWTFGLLAPSLDPAPPGLYATQPRPRIRECKVGG
jgi:pimeloyl-ACP methyl ester carboxylesterase